MTRSTLARIKSATTRALRAEVEAHRIAEHVRLLRERSAGTSAKQQRHHERSAQFLAHGDLT